MARSQSESSIHGPPTATSSAAIFSILGPNRSRRSTVSSQTGADKEKSGADKDAKNRSRSGSMLERFALGNKNKKRGGEGDDETAPSPEGAASSAPTSGASTPSRFAPSMPSLPTLGSFKKLSLQSSPGKYGTLADAHHEPSSSPSGSFSSSASGSASGRRLPPALKRTQTAPAASPTPSSPSRARPPPPLPSRAPAAGPVGQTYRAQWAYKPAATVPDDEDDEEEGAGELELEKGDVVRVEKEVNADWWIGVGVQGAAQGRRGMFPSAYVVPHALEAHSDDEDDEDEARRGAQSRWTTFGNASTSFSASSDGHDASVGRPSFDGDALTDTDDGEHGLLDNGAQGRTASPFGDPRERRARQRGETITASPFDDDRVSYAHARGESSR
ncbi:hypothetical protein Rhopal_006985-T1 [Rhodotorula paludigena]|uniref:SH3 domain-containing protein n=1 Tax=Rhodotorula paludigena TaxID=86838 RepID=A0AAV5GWQ7_9BASI|nr:hypothetical protein Rhopal_006985-T1 [Rhodotorula paludigena]